MKFDPEEANNLVKEGPVDWEVIKSVDHTTKSGNECIKVIFKIWDTDGKEGVATRYLTQAWMLKQLCEACDMMDKFKTGEVLASDLQSKTGKGISKIEKDPEGVHEDKNVIVKFLKPVATSGVVDKTPPFEDDIPF